MLIRDILEESARKHADIMAVKWLAKKEIRERSYRHLAENIAMVRKGLLAEGFREKHIALIGASSVEWIESYLGIITGRNVAVPLDANLPGEDLVDLIDRSDSEGLFLSPKHTALLDAIAAGCPNCVFAVSDGAFQRHRGRLGQPRSRGYGHHHLHIRNHGEEQGRHADPG